MSVNLFKIIFIQLICICIFSHASATKQSIAADTAIVKIKSKDTTGYPVRLAYTDNNESKFVLNAKAVDGIYEFHIPVKGYSKAILYISSLNNIIKAGQGFIPQPAPAFLIKGGQVVSITADFNNPLDFSLKAKDPGILLYESYSTKERQNHQLVWAQTKIKYGQSDQPEKVSLAAAEIAKLSRDLNAYKKAFVAGNKNTYPALLVFESYYTELGNGEALKQLKSIAPAYQNAASWKALYAKLDAANATEKGAVIPAFQVEDLNGKIFNSQVLGGKYLLIDFWGSWCQPCRASHPELKALYERYKSKGLEILGIAYESGSVESQLKQWKKAIAEDQINWIQVLNTPQNNLVKLFGISSYPTKILVDPTGNILFRSNGSAVELKKQLAAIFDQKSASLASLNKNISRDSLLNYLNQKLNENTVQSKAILKEEAAALKKSATEENLLLARKLYDAMGNADEIETLEQDILKKFPKGILARDLAYNNIFGVNPEPATDVVEKDYLSWLKLYPAANYELRNREKYNFALLTLIQRFSKAKQEEKVNAYLAQLLDPNLKAVALYNVGKDFMSRSEVLPALKYLNEALILSKQAKESADPKMRKGFAAMYYDTIVNDYAAALLSNGQLEESIMMCTELLTKSNYTGMNSQSLVLTLAKALTGKDEQLNAFLALDKFLQKNPQSPEIMELCKALYLKLNGSKSDFQQYLNLLLAEKQKAQMEHLKSVMVREKAPLFSLYNRKGERVNLADYKGKLVVLDFWATWCVPCIQSFPGMQAVIDKYKSNKDVEFLFIDTWETKADYEKGVNDLMDKHNYTFHVLYDKPIAKNEEITVKKYGVSAIPAKFIIDKNGDIRFKVSSSRTDKESVLNEMSDMIDMILKQ